MLACSRRGSFRFIARAIPASSQSLGVLWRLRQDGFVALGPALKECLGAIHVERAGEQESLSSVAVLVFYQGELLLVLDALGERLDRERLAELDERVDQGLALLVVLQLGDEGAVDLQRLDRGAWRVS